MVVILSSWADVVNGDPVRLLLQLLTDEFDVCGLKLRCLKLAFVKPLTAVTVSDVVAGVEVLLLMLLLLDFILVLIAL